MIKWVSVVIPVRHSPGTVRRVVDALLTQTYRGPVEVILVGDRNDPAWQPFRVEIDACRVLTVEVDGPGDGRDADRRRNAGLNAACGDVLCLTDDDMVPAPDWVATGVALLAGRWRCAAAPRMRIPAGLFLAREVYERVGGFDPQWLQRAGDAGYEILYTPRLVAHRDRRQGRRDLVGGYHHAGRRRRPI